MKQSNLITKIVILILFVGVVFYLAVYAGQSLSDSFSSVMAFQDTLNDSVKVSGIVVREEFLLPEGADIMDILPDEGERVAKGDAVAVLYENASALERKKELQLLKQERAQLEYVLNSGSSLSDAAKLEQQIIESIISLRSDTAGGDLSCVDSTGLSLRTQILQREFTYSASGDNAEALTGMIADLNEKISSLEAQSTADTLSITSPSSGLFSSVTDGLETSLTPDSLNSLTADQLISYMDKEPTPQAAVGKLVTGDRWYFATVIDAETAQRVREGDYVTVSFSRDFTGELLMRIDRLDSEGGDQRVLVLSSDRNLKELTMLRTQNVELIFHSYTGIRVPKQALHMETLVSTDSDSGEQVRSQILGIYTVVNGRAEFNLVDIVREGSDFYLVSPSEKAYRYDIEQRNGEYYLTTHQEGEGLHILRAGDEVIMSASNLYEGKVVVE